MITLQEAFDIVLDHTMDYGTEGVHYEAAVGRVLAKPVKASRDLPPFDRVAMDGIAVLYEMVESGQRRFEMERVIAAGDPLAEVEDPRKAVEIMTGAALPEGVDTVIRYEDLKVGDGWAEIMVDTVVRGQNIHHRGKDNHVGEVLIPAGKRLTPTDISMLASEGMVEVEVFRVPSFGIISSGDELVSVAEEPAPHQIRRSNVYAIQALLAPYHPRIEMYHFKDDKDDIRRGLREAFESHDALILVGGVSKGKFDYIPGVLSELGAEKHFHRVAQRPGKPFWFGTLGRKCIFALPGNPVSSMASTVRYVIPWMRACLGLEADYSIPVVLSKGLEFKPTLTRLLEASLTVDDKGVCRADPQPGHGSGDFTRLVYSDGFLELPADKPRFEAGEIYPFWRTVFD